MRPCSVRSSARWDRSQLMAIMHMQEMGRARIKRWCSSTRASTPISCSICLAPASRSARRRCDPLPFRRAQVRVYVCMLQDHIHFHNTH